MKNIWTFGFVAIAALGIAGYTANNYWGNNGGNDLSSIEPAAGDIGSESLTDILQGSYVRANDALERANQAIEDRTNFIEGIDPQSNEFEMQQDEAEVIQFLNDIEPSSGN